METMTRMPQFKSHKKVWALKIKDVVVTGDTAHLTFEGHSAPLTVSIEKKPTPEPGWYFVEYEDGYTSFSPAKQFEEGYTRMSELGLERELATFGWALKQLHNGARIARSGWNGKGMFLYLVPPGSYPARTDVAKQEWGDQLVPYRAYIAMKTAQGDVVPWVASQSDILETDWQTV
jgi:hypothetical protein